MRVAQRIVGCAVRRARDTQKKRDPLLRCVIGVALARPRTYAKGQFFNHFSGG